jgi:hypothetical protein
VRFLRATHLVICCRPGNAEVAMTRMAKLMVRLGLDVNTTKTRIARLPEEQFDFLGYEVGRFYGKDGRSYFGTRPSKEGGKERAQTYPRADRRVSGMRTNRPARWLATAAC